LLRVNFINTKNMRKKQTQRKLRSTWLKLLLLFNVFALSATAQTKITGKVTDEGGVALSNVSVSLKADGSGAATLADGTYSFTTTLTGTQVLVFSRVNYKSYEQAITINGDVTTNASLKFDPLGLDEVVVIGSSLSSKRKALGNTVNSINNKQLQNTGSGNITSAIQGKIPGAQITQTSGDPAGGISVRMRGTSTISGSTEPLYVIDGVVVSNVTTNVTSLFVDAGRESAVGTNRLADINPNDIEKIDVIPGAAASAIYGSRASNGVVLITTKKGKSGALKIDFSTSIISNSLRKKVYVTKHGKMFGVKNFANNGQPYALGMISNAPSALNGYTGAVTPTYTRPNDGIPRTFATDVVDVQRYDYQDNIFRTGMGSDTYIGLSGGNEKSRFYFSAGYFKNEGIVVGADFKRINFKTRFESNISKTFNLSGGLAYTNSFANEKPNGNSFTSPINAMNITNNVFDISARDAGGNLRGVDWVRINPMSSIEEMDFTNSVNRIIGDIQLKIKPVKDVTIDYIIGVDNLAQEGNSFIKRYAYGVTNTVATGNKPFGYASTALINNIQLNNDLNISYAKNFNKFSSVTTAGFNHQYQKGTSLFIEGDDMLNGITNISGAAVVTAPRYSKDEVQIYGAYLQETFGYNNLVYLTAAGRFDGSTAFPSQNRTYFYPKVSTAINLSDFGFWEKNKIDKVVSNARLRASWGIAGNLTGIGPYSRFSAFSAGAINNVTGFNLNAALGNPDVAPERTREFEVGTDLSFFKNRLNIVFNVYNKATIDNSLLVLRNLAPSSGGTSRYENVGNMTNKGWELSVTGAVVKKRDVTVDLFGSLARNKNLVTQTSQVAPIFLTNALGATNTFIIQAGQPAGAIQGGYFVRDAAGDKTLDAGGRLVPALNGTAQAIKILGSPHPDWLVSFGSSVTYKRISFNVLFDGALGQEVFNADRRTRQGVGFGDLAEKEIKGELPRGYIFALYTTEEYRVESGSYIKLRELSLSYDLPKIAKFVKNASLTFTGRNLISFDNYDGYDPETNAGGNSSVLRGIDFGNVPNPKTFQVTLRTSF
jgi:TonB-linked SusC/RagA family outer membrane protein